ncbi:muscle M-line assembly protein unc-89 isoform X2 [Gadus chalcogrammus]|uniref:muscle M-line assembly protein unc-89 isoform X2 n=1 Tax=Gadus chalcogrammus TaxID=1042646 RepID=UPI0024C37748|nr:muscle M-line assembly protein unc-89 isoform X2 [Gadus chalcogrammus]
MSEGCARPASTSPVSSISLLEIKGETRLVLKAFLRKSLDLPLGDRPGRVGGAYKDNSKYSCVPQLGSKARNGFHSQDEEASSGDERKKGLKSLLQRTMRRPPKDPAPGNKDPNGSLEKDARLKAAPGLAVNRLRVEDEAFSPSSTSEEDNGEPRLQKKTKKSKKLKKQFSDLFRRKNPKDSPEKTDPRPPRPTKLSLNIGLKAPDLIDSPNHPPEFYEDVAERLERIAKRSNTTKRIASPVEAPAALVTISSTAQPTEPVLTKDEVVNQLINVLSMEADAITSKIESDPFLRNKLTRLSYPSFAKLLDAFSNIEAQPAVPPLPAPPPGASPTLRRVAVTMEVSRRVVTATGTQRMQGYAERYMETFAPWLKSHGGWENIVHLEEASEFD